MSERTNDRFTGITKWLYGEKVQALRRRFKRHYDGSANDAHCVMEFFARITANDDSSHYTELDNALIGDIADAVYVKEAFVRSVIDYCIELEIFSTTDDGKILELKDWTVLSQH